jgi:hypothetical protein
MPTRIEFLGLAVGAILAAGCGGPAAVRVPVAGTVTHDGRPVPAGRVELLPDTARGGSGPAGYATIVDGRFDTRASGRDIAPGPTLAVVRGTDGRPGPVEGQESGQPLFEPHSHPFDAAQGMSPIVIDVPVGAEEAQAESNPLNLWKSESQARKSAVVRGGRIPSTRASGLEILTP